MKIIHKVEKAARIAVIIITLRSIELKSKKSVKKVIAVKITASKAIIMLLILSRGIEALISTTRLMKAVISNEVTVVFSSGKMPMAVIS